METSEQKYILEDIKKMFIYNMLDISITKKNISV